MMMKVSVCEPNVRPIKVYWGRVVLVSLEAKADLINRTGLRGWWWRRLERLVLAPLADGVVGGGAWFSRCTGTASGSPRRSPASSTRCTWKPPAVSCSAPSWERCPGDQKRSKQFSFYPTDHRYAGELNIRN